jgi:cell division protein FtsL
MATPLEVCQSEQQEMKKDICELYERSIPTWARTLIVSGIVASFAVIGSFYLYATEHYATRDEVDGIERRIERLEQADGKRHRELLQAIDDLRNDVRDAK